MSTCRIRTICLALSFIAIAVIFIFGVILPKEAYAETNAPIPSFAVKNFSGSIDSTGLFVGRRVVLAVIGSSCSQLGNFLAWRKRLSPEKTDQALILCVGGKREEQDVPLWSAPNTAILALGITGTPMLLGIEENHVKWRIAGLIAQWQVLAENWLKNENEQK